MFYHPEILQRRSGCFGTIWLAATCVSRLQRREVMAVDVPRTCSALAAFVQGLALPRSLAPPLPAEAPPLRCSLYLAALLQLGLTRVYWRQCGALAEEVAAVWGRLHRLHPPPTIDLSPTARLQLLPDAQCAMAALEFAPDPFFGLMEGGAAQPHTAAADPGGAALPWRRSCPNRPRRSCSSSVRPNRSCCPTSWKCPRSPNCPQRNSGRSRSRVWGCCPPQSPAPSARTSGRGGTSAGGRGFDAAGGAGGSGATGRGGASRAPAELRPPEVVGAALPGLSGSVRCWLAAAGAVPPLRTNRHPARPTRPRPPLPQPRPRGMKGAWPRPALFYWTVLGVMAAASSNPCKGAGSGAGKGHRWGTGGCCGSVGQLWVSVGQLWVAMGLYRAVMGRYGSLWGS
ncbi:meiotic recombination protein REC8 homolog isoform X14 [Gallus gallus]|uniref:meiotic recombination protein REC8 homolog isoform X14 n=1 Tax=Gallus gallus TaxID=9031 RepID=UPI001AE4D4B3|nr:meiotic recombination protein REC8 homolog isoform X14 [Gallus gallus]